MARELNKILDRLESRCSLFSAAGGPALTTVLTGYFASVSDWVNQVDVVAWMLLGLLAGVLTAALLLIVFETRYRRNRAWAIRDWVARAEQVNPLDQTFTKRRISLESLADPLSNQILGKTFTDYDLVGLAIIFPFRDCNISGVHFRNRDFIALRKDAGRINNAIILIKCNILDGSLSGVTVIADAVAMKKFLAAGATPLTLTYEDARD